MKVTVTLTLNVDPVDWSLAYGTGTKEADVREAVKRYLLNLAQNCAAAEEGGIRSATLR